MASSVQSNRPSTPNYGCWKKCNMWCWKAFQWLPVLLIVSIVTWSYYAYVYQLCFSTITSSLQQWAYLAIYHVLLIMFAWSYWRTIFANIEQIPSKYFLTGAELEKLLSVDTEEEQRTIIENFAKDLPIVTRTMSGSVRYCNRCLLVKPDRAHHCSICSRCVLKMDHHCPWVKNCVCFQNYKFFMLFLGYALLYCLFVMSTCLPYFIKFWKGEMGTAGSPGRYHIVFAFFVALMFAISLGSLFGYHCYLVAHNRTTLEMLVYSRRLWSPNGFSIVKTVVDDVLSTRPKNKAIDFSTIKTIAVEAFRAPMFRGGADKNGFSLGAFNNFKEVFGKRPNLWPLPVFTSSGNGCEYPVRREHQLQIFAAAPDARYESMGTTRSSFGDGIVFPLPKEDEDTESLLSSERWDRWGERARPFDDLDGSSIDEI